MCRLLGRPASSFACAGDYESVSAPVFAWRDAVARDSRTGSALNGYATLTAWSALRGREEDDGHGPAWRRAPQRHDSLARTIRKRAIVAGFPLAVALLNRAGLGPLKAEISTSELRRAGLQCDGRGAQLGWALVTPTSSSGTHTAPVPRITTRRASGAEGRAHGL